MWKKRPIRNIALLDGIKECGVKKGCLCRRCGEKIAIQPVFAGMQLKRSQRECGHLYSQSQECEMVSFFFFLTPLLEHNNGEASALVSQPPSLVVQITTKCAMT